MFKSKRVQSFRIETITENPQGLFNLKCLLVLNKNIYCSKTLRVKRYIRCRCLNASPLRKFALPLLGGKKNPQSFGCIASRVIELFMQNKNYLLKNSLTNIVQFLSSNFSNCPINNSPLLTPAFSFSALGIF